ncbi:MAG: hypothetical protein J6032_04570 [Bacteroidales bacterium]|nr:hypothetical protein [Bacteroidales bacterium]
MIKVETLRKFQRWYTVIVLIIILGLLIGGGYFYPKVGCYLFFCLAVLAVVILLVTRSLISHNIPKDKPKFRNQKK